MSDAHLVPPRPVFFDGPGTLRFVVEAVDGRRSATWSVVGHANTEDVYIGLRQVMSEIELSLHSRTWRLALTAHGARNLPAGQDRVLYRWHPTEELAPGWQRAFTLMIPTSSLSFVPPEKKPKGGATVAVFPAPHGDWALRFDTLLGMPERGKLIVNDAVAEVGSMTLSSGKVVWVVASEVQLKPAYRQRLREIRAESHAGSLAQGIPDQRTWAWGVDDNDGGPTMVDLGEPRMGLMSE